MTILRSDGFWSRPLVFACLLLAAHAAHGQAGPPMITNDPDTPGAGAWEINLAATGGRAHGTWDVDAPDIDINHGIGARIQVSLHAPWAHQRDPDGGWISGLGAIELGLRWRFLDQAQAGVAMAVQPMWISSWSRAAERRGLASPDNEFVLPLQVARRFANIAAGVEVARHFIGRAPDAWQAGVFVERDCRATVQCLAEINTSWPGDDGPHTIVNLGGRKALGAHATLLGSLGSELTGNARQPLVFYLGVQLTD